MEHTLRILRFALIVFLAASAALSQNPRGSITGLVTDASGSVMVNVALRALNTETGVAAAALTNEAGRFEIPFLLPGTYTITAEMAGFRRFVRGDVQVRMSETVEVPVRMELGDTTETVEVKAQTPLLDTSDASLGRVIDETRVKNLPERGGNPMELELLAPGVVNATNLRLRKPSSPDALSSVSADGNPQTKNEYQIDGIFNGAADGGRGASRIAFSPPSGAVREFKIQTSPYDASQGHSIGAVMSITTASGTNGLHGEAHFFARNSALDAPNFFNNKNNTSAGKYRDDRYGFTAGGPVYIPHFYNGKNKTFWLYSWERNSPWTDPRAWTLTVPTAAERQGDFSELLKAGNTYQIYNPFTTVALANGRFQRDAFAGNIIPKSMLDAVGVKLVNLFPLPNRAGTIDGRNNYFNGSDVDHNNYHVNLLRLDHAFSDNNRAFIRLQWDRYEIGKWTYFSTDPNLLLSDGIFEQRINKGIALDDVWVLSPTLVMNVRYGLTNTEFPQQRINQGYDLSTLGFSAALIKLVNPPALATIPNLKISGYQTISDYENPGDGSNTSMTHSLTVNFTKTLRNHSFKFGVDERLDRAFQNRYPFDVSPQLTPPNTYTRGPLDNSPAASIGQELASLLLGIPGGSMTRSASAAVQDIFTGLYFQDDWKITPRLTLNVGLRYELETPVTERYNRLVGGFDFTTPNPIQAAAQANYASIYAKTPIAELPPAAFKVLGGLQWVNQNGTGRSPFKGEQSDFLPRFGFAYLLTSKTTVRGGYGMYYDTIGVYSFLPIQSGFTSTTPIQTSLDNGLTYVATNANPFPAGLLPQVGAAGGLTTLLSQPVSFFNPNLRRPYSQRWSFGVQRELPGSFLLEASYVGNRGTRLPVTRNLNNTPAQYLSTKRFRDQATIDFLSQTFNSPFFGLDPIFGKTISRGSLLKPFPEFGNITTVDSVGYSWYHAMQLQVEKRFARGYTFQLGYTFSKLMDATSFLNSTDALPYRNISSMDYPHRLSLSGVWELPFGRGRQFGSQLWRPANFVIGGWQLSGIFIHQAGAPLTFGDIIFNGDIHNIALPSDKRSADKWINVGAGFNRVSNQQLASDIRTFPFRLSGVRGPGQDSADLSAVKQFSIVERVQIQFRFDAYNAFNHTNLSSPSSSNLNPTSSTFGVITGTDGDARNLQLALKLTF